MPNQVIILRGTPGSGKSTLAKKLVHDFEIVDSYNTGLIFSADNYFIKEGEYKFDRDQLSKAHGQCLRQFVQQLYGSWCWPNTRNHLFIIDNTNLSLNEVNLYAALCNAYDTPFKIISINMDPEKAWSRNVHSVSQEHALKMYKIFTYGLKSMPKHWPHEIIEGKE